EKKDVRGELAHVAASKRSDRFRLVPAEMFEDEVVSVAVTFRNRPHRFEILEPLETCDNAVLAVGAMRRMARHRRLRTHGKSEPDNTAQHDNRVLHGSFSFSIRRLTVRHRSHGAPCRVRVKQIARPQARLVPYDASGRDAAMTRTVFVLLN